jgi:hypothetical protein
MVRARRLDNHRTEQIMMICNEAAEGTREEESG